MFGARWRMFRLVGIPVTVDASWLIILALLTLSFAQGFPVLIHEYFPADDAVLPAVDFWMMGFLTALAFFACILLHELGHAIVARARGMRINGINLFLFGGVAELGEEPSSAGTEFLMAIAGPIVSLLLAIAFWLAAEIGYAKYWPHPIVIVLGYLATINATVLAFNLIPAFPLDGGRVLRSILWSATANIRTATRWAAMGGQLFAWALMAWGVLQFFSGNWIGGIWMGLIGMFLQNAAVGAYQQVLVRQTLHGETVRHFMNAHPISVSPTLTLRSWVDEFVYRYHRTSFPVVEDGRLEGLIETSVMSEIPKPEWDDHTVGEMMRHPVTNLCIAPDTDALVALEKMQRAGAGKLLVTEQDRLIGILSIKDLMRFLNLKLKLEDSDHGAPSPDGPVNTRQDEMAHS